MLSDILSNFLKRIDKKLAGIFLFNIATFGIAVWALVETIDQGKQSTEALIEAKKQTDFIIEQRKNEILVNNNISTKERCEIIYENINSNKNISNIKFGPCKLDNIATSSKELIDLKFNKVELSNLKVNSSDIDGTWFEDVSMDNLVLNDVKKFHSTFINSEINKLTISNVLYGSPKIKSNSHIGELNLNNSRLSSIAIYSSIVENTKFTNSKIGVMYSNGNFSIGNNVNINIDKLTIGTDSKFHNSYFNEANINSLDGSGYQLSEIIFFGSKINNIRLDSVVLNGVHFNNSKLGKLYLSVLGNKSKYIKNLTFNSSDLSGATLHNWEAAFLKEVDFSESNISGLRMNIRACSLSDVNLIRKKLSKAWAWSDNLPRISIRCDSPYDADIAVNSYKICPNSIQTNYEKHQGFGIPKGC